MLPPVLSKVECSSDHEPVFFLGRRLPSSFEMRLVMVDPGAEHAYDEREWRDALVVVEAGAIDLECMEGGGARFECGAVLFLVGLPLRALVNRGAEPAILSAVARRRKVDEF